MSLFNYMRRFLVFFISVTMALISASSCDKGEFDWDGLEGYGFTKLYDHKAISLTESTLTAGLLLPADVDPDVKFGFLVSTKSKMPSDKRIETFGEISYQFDHANTKIYLTADVAGLDKSKTYYYAAFYSLDGKYKLSEIKTFVPGTVDIGLSVKWALCNVGASAPEEYGDYFAWGDTKPKETYTMDNRTYHGTARILPLSADAAHVIWGGKWRMPTREEQKELSHTYSNTDYNWEWISVNGHKGIKVTYLINGNSVLFPTTGTRAGDSFDFPQDTECYYWTSTRMLEGDEMPEYLDYYQDHAYSMASIYLDPTFWLDAVHISQGMPIRPVCVK